MRWVHLVNISQKVCLQLTPKHVETRCWVAKTARYRMTLDDLELLEDTYFPALAVNISQAVARTHCCRALTFQSAGLSYLECQIAVLPLLWRYYCQTSDYSYNHSGRPARQTTPAIEVLNNVSYTDIELNFLLYSRRSSQCVRCRPIMHHAIQWVLRNAYITHRRLKI